MKNTGVNGSSDTYLKSDGRVLRLDKTNLICPSFRNNFSLVEDELASLKQLIQTQGMWDPIQIIPINKRLNENLAEGEEKYLLKRKEDGYSYVVVEGNRRLMCIVSLALGYNTFSRDEVVKNKKKLDELYIGKSDEAITVDNYLKIKTFNVDATSIMNVALNLSSRASTQFEYVINTIPLVDKNSKTFEADIIRKIKELYGKDMALTHVNKFVKLNELGDEFVRLVLDKKVSLRNAEKLVSKENLDFIGKSKENKLSVLKRLEEGKIIDFSDVSLLEKKKKRGVKKKETTYTKAQVKDILTRLKIELSSMGLRDSSVMRMIDEELEINKKM